MTKHWLTTYYPNDPEDLNLIKDCRKGFAVVFGKDDLVGMLGLYVNSPDAFPKETHAALDGIKDHIADCMIKKIKKDIAKKKGAA